MYTLVQSLRLGPLLVGSAWIGMLLGGCGTMWSNLRTDADRLRIKGQISPHTTMRGNFETGLYRYDDPNQLTAVLLDGPLDRPDQAMTIRMLWHPRAGRTPIDPNATNATVHHIIFAGPDRQQVGVYSGAGYLFPRSQPGDRRLNASLWQADLRLSDASTGFRDLLGHSILQGRFAANPDDFQTQETLRTLEQLIQKKLGHPRLVRTASLHPVARQRPPPAQ